jgi:hypothetical protein
MMFKMILAIISIAWPMFFLGYLLGAYMTARKLGGVAKARELLSAWLLGRR